MTTKDKLRIQVAWSWKVLQCLVGWFCRNGQLQNWHLKIQELSSPAAHYCAQIYWSINNEACGAEILNYSYSGH